MNLGCLEDCMFVSNKQNPKIVVDSQINEGKATDESLASSSSRTGKNKSTKDISPSALNSLNKFTSQIKKPSHRKNSPLNWFPRKKIDSYLKRKIKMLQEVDGMNLTLDETLEDSNPHYCRVLREKMAAREAAHKAIEARKAALVEASWCRILQAARIRSTEADELLLKAEKTAAAAFDSATALGVIMYDIPNCAKSTCQIEASTINKAGSTTHTIRASFETAFEVDKQVAAAVKTAFRRLASCSSFNKDEFKDLLRKINENPDTGYNNLESAEISSECQSSEAASELEALTQEEGFKSEDFNCKMSASKTREKKAKRRQSLEKLNPEKLVEIMVERLKCLREDELSSLATIVATCGLNAALAEVEHTKLHPSASALNFDRRASSIGAGTVRKTNQTGQHDSELPSLDKFLVKHMTKLELEVQEARSRRNESKDESGHTLVKHSLNSEEDIQANEKSFDENSGVDPRKSDEDISVEVVPDLGRILVKHSSKLEKEIQEAKRNHGNTYERRGVSNGGTKQKKGDIVEVPSLDKFLVKHVSRLEREVEEAKSRRKNNLVEKGKEANGEEFGKENINLNTEVNRTESEDSLDKILVKPRNHKKQGGTHVTDCESLDKVLVKHVSRLEKEKLRFNANEEEMVKVKKRGGVNMTPVDDQGSLDQILIKHKSKLEKEKMATGEKPSEQIRFSVSRREARERELQEDCESLDKVLVKHVSRLQKEKLRFKANEEEMVKVKKRGGVNMTPVDDQGSLDQILVKHKSKLEKEKMATGEQIRFSVSRREARERELQEAWGGLSLGNSMKPHLSRLERDKAAWKKAEEEERMQAVME
ncbi:golgin subfamily A member 4-like [Hibiscus syriacus]|uniref:golgin subfamily A member 4-like n=1 Tax=Hibiscus syriacus TaxID=106335 RepID=UPI001923C292|nr:golgin subfamily A member 4-like [Hibiscus syriacus]